MLLEVFIKKQVVVCINGISYFAVDSVLLLLWDLCISDDKIKGNILCFSFSIFVGCRGRGACSRLTVITD